MPTQKHITSSFRCAFLFYSVLSLTACLETNSLRGGESLSSQFVGCTSGNGLTNTSIRVNFGFPSDADKVIIYRNGLEAGISNSGATTFIVDAGLTEGETYTYTCHAFRGARKIIGSNSIQVSPVNTNSPIFTGINAVTNNSSANVEVSWQPESAEGAKASYYKIYASVGNTLDWNTAAIAQIDADGIFKYNLNTLGDELKYSFGVRACTKDNICDSNTKSLSLVTLDRGAPSTSGIDRVYTSNFIAYIVAPWVHTNGGIKSRKIYSCMGANCSFGGASKSYDAINPAETVQPSTLELENIQEYQSYSFKIVDEDSYGNTKSSNIVTLSVGDLAAPLFGGLIAVDRDSTHPESAVQLSFLPLSRQGTSDSDAANGVTDYLLYYTSSSYSSNPTDSCNKTTPDLVISAANILPVTGGQYLLSQLNPRTKYSFCLRARDAAGNTSVNNNSLSVTTSDVVSPTFAGIQAISFNSTTKKINIAWNPSPDTDLREYQLTLWKNSATPVSGTTTTIKVSPSNSTGIQLSLADYTYVGLDTVYAIVNACDNTLDLGTGRADNCSSFTFTGAKSVTIPDITPPQGFTGIQPLGTTNSNTESQAFVAWFTPTTWTSDYQGFRIYSVNPTTEALTLLKTCTCQTPGACTNSDNSCTVTGLNAGRTYRFHVRAFDLVGNETDYLTPSTNYTDVKIKDSTAPSFASGLSISLMTLSWASATDNQYNDGVNNITYEVWRKSTTAFTSPTSPDSEGTLITSLINTTSYLENTITAGGTFWYTVCAKDSQNNRKCDGNQKQLIVTDPIAPTIQTFTHTKSSDTIKRWNLNWTLNDNATSVANLRVRLYVKYGNDSTVFATSTNYDLKVVDALGTTLAKNNEVGPLNSNSYISYQLWVQDEAGNTATSNLLINSNNIVKIDSIAATSGLVSGGRIVLIQGTGFSTSANNGYATSTLVRFGTALACTNIVIITDSLLSCKTPAGSAGIYDVTVINPEGSSSSLIGAYTYLSSSSAICDNSSLWGTDFATGNGTEANPFIICNPTHLATALSSSFISYLLHFKLGDNIDLSLTPVSTTNGFSGTLDGDGYALLNNVITTDGTSSTAQFMRLVGNSNISIKNINFLGFKIINNYSSQYARSGVFQYNASNGVIELDNVRAEIKYEFPNATNTTIAGFLASYSQWDSANNITINVNNCNLNGETTGASPVFGGVLAVNFTGGSYAQTPIISVIDSKITSNIIAPSGAIYAGGIYGATQERGEITVLRSHVKINISRSAASSSSVSAGGISANGMASKIDVQESRITPNYQSITNGAIGGIAGSNISSTGSYLNLSDIVIDGDMSSSTTSRGLIGVSWKFASTHSLNFNNVLAVSKIVASGTRFPAPIMPTTVTNIVSGPILYNADELTSYSSAGTYQMIPATGYSTANLQSQTSGNILETSGFDFTTGTGKWKWCRANEYPRLQWESCN